MYWDDLSDSLKEEYDEERYLTELCASQIDGAHAKFKERMKRNIMARIHADKYQQAQEYYPQQYVGETVYATKGEQS